MQTPVSMFCASFTRGSSKRAGRHANQLVKYARHAGRRIVSHEGRDAVTCKSRLGEQSIGVLHAPCVEYIAQDVHRPMLSAYRFTGNKGGRIDTLCARIGVCRAKHVDEHPFTAVTANELAYH